MATTLWLRNPDRYIQAAVQSGIYRWALTEQDDPQGFMNFHLPHQKYYCLAVEEDRATLFDRDHSMDNPIIVMQVSDAAGVDEDELMQMVTFEDEEELFEVGDIRAGIHLADCRKFSTAFGHRFPSADIDFSTFPDAFFVHPGGGLLRIDQAKTNHAWISLLGYHWEEMAIPEVRFAFNISAARWAADYFTDDKAVQNQASDKDKTRWSVRERGTKPLAGDKYYCGLCSFSQSCPKYREGFICTMADEPGRLAAKFGSRDPWTIIDGLTDIAQDGVERYEMGRRREDEGEKLDPAVTALASTLFRQGKVLLQLNNPEFRNPVLQITAMGNVGISSGQQQTPQTLASQAQQALIRAGCQEDQISFEHIQELVDLGITDQAVSQMARLIQNPVIEAGETSG